MPAAPASAAPTGPGASLRRRVARHAAPVCAAAALLAGCAITPPAGPGAEPPTTTQLRLGGSDITAVWTLPAGSPRALVTLQHGFARSCARLATTARRLAERGMLTLCIEAPMARGNPAMADALAAWLAGGPPAPDGSPLPAKIIVAGHSAGAAFAARLGARLDAAAPQRLAGALLFDPVATDFFEADLQALARAGERPVLAITAAAGGCNAQHNAYPALRALRVASQAAGRASVATIELGEGASHADVEGEDSDWIAAAACGRPQPARSEQLRALAVQWVADVADGSPPRPAPPGSARSVD
jgi:alpha/beta hydrolase fold